MNVTVDLDASRQLWQEDVNWELPVAEEPVDVEATEDYNLQIHRLIFAVENLASQFYRTSACGTPISSLTFKSSSACVVRRSRHCAMSSPEGRYTDNEQDILM